MKAWSLSFGSSGFAQNPVKFRLEHEMKSCSEPISREYSFQAQEISLRQQSKMSPTPGGGSGKQLSCLEMAMKGEAGGCIDLRSRRRKPLFRTQIAIPAAKLENVDEQEEEAEIGEFGRGSKGNGSFPGDFLQSIENYDLKYIKELGYELLIGGKDHDAAFGIEAAQLTCEYEGSSTASVQVLHQFDADFFLVNALLYNLLTAHLLPGQIGDFGLSDAKQRMLSLVEFEAPELLKSQKNMVTDRVDFSSFGIVMWELLTGEEPYGNMRSEEIIDLIEREEMRKSRLKHLVRRKVLVFNLEEAQAISLARYSANRPDKFLKDR
ncbi:hypothetical protein Vadar_016996 [Vaccinium darrowii]|uniref:Uncharacterized protein n=1 Tax=Vaccinium darrowii TaxID=229202 RepID=A0ACB7XS84_9ERIC|nr:hypothetical protein Vadar_016996 [Vaccinium darrowii]